VTTAKDLDVVTCILGDSPLNFTQGHDVDEKLKATEDEQAEDADTALLVARAQKGDRDAFAAIYERFFGRVYSNMRALLHDQHEAEDGASDVWLKAMEALPRYEQREQPFRAWLFTIVRNTGLDRIAAKARTEPFDPAELDSRREAPDPESGLNALERIKDKELLLFIDRLPTAQRQVLALRFLLNLRPAEIAKVLGRTRTDVSTLQYRALRFLEKRLDAIGRSPTSSGGDDLAPMRRWGTPANVTRSRRFALHNKRPGDRDR
jgi:RNA polymerase sigma-70 factor, ECF subfamily